MDNNIISSSQNENFKHIIKLTSSKFRKQYNEFLIEGERSVNDAVKNGASVVYIAVSQTYTGKIPKEYETYFFSEKLFLQLKNTVNSQGIIAVVKMKNHSCEKFNFDGTVVYLDGISDPGNMGTIIRTCNAAGVNAIVLSKNCVDIYNPKVVRSTMASLFNVNIFYDESLLKRLKNNGYCIAGAYLHSKKSLYDIDFCQKTVIVIGNEANGISDDVIKICDEKFKIPMTENCESLNAAISCGVCVYESMRQKLLSGN